MPVTQKNAAFLFLILFESLSLGHAASPKVAVSSAPAISQSAESTAPAPSLAALTTGYWLRRYDIPEFYSTISAGIASTDPALASRKLEAVLTGLGADRVAVDKKLVAEGIAGGQWPAEGQTVWEIPSSKAANVEAALRRQKGFNYIKKRKADSPRNELILKHDGLLREANEHFEIIASTTLRTFLESELQALNQLLWRDRVSQADVGVFVTIAPPGKSPPYVDAPSGRLRASQTLFAQGDPAWGEIHLSSASNPFPFAFWNRVSPEGEARTEATIVIDMSGDPNYHTERFGEQVPKKAARFGATAYSSSGKFLEFPGWQGFDILWPPMYFTIPLAKLTAFRDGMAPGALLVYWGQSEESAVTFAAASKKRGLLLGERERLVRVLQATPLTRTLVDAEIDRLRPLAEKFAAQNGTAAVRVILATRRKR